MQNRIIVFARQMSGGRIQERSSQNEKVNHFVWLLTDTAKPVR
jgi:hypothetical protein